MVRSPQLLRVPVLLLLLLMTTAMQLQVSKQSAALGVDDDDVDDHDDDVDDEVAIVDMVEVFDWCLVSMAVMRRLACSGADRRRCR